MYLQINFNKTLILVSMLLVSCASNTKIPDENSSFYYPISEEEALTWRNNSQTTTKKYESDKFSSLSTAELRAGVHTACRRDAPSYFKYPHTVEMNWIDGISTSGTRATGIVVIIPATAENAFGMRMNGSVAISHPAMIIL